jgi:hypothetical protein
MYAFYILQEVVYQIGKYRIHGISKHIIHM